MKNKKYFKPPPRKFPIKTAAKGRPDLVHELQIRGLFHEVHKVPWQGDQNFIDLAARMYAAHVPLLDVAG